VKKGPNPGQAYPIFAERITIGRDPMSDIIFKDPEVSRRHVQFARVRDTYQVEDLGSTNGTFVNGERLTGEPSRLSIGQEIALGGAITLIFDEDNGTDYEVLGTLNTNVSVEEAEPYVTTADDDDYLDEYIYEGDRGTSELDEEVVDDEEPHIDQLQSIPALAASPSSHSRIAKTATQSTSETPAASKNVRMMTTQQITYIVVGTVLGTLICCGSLLLFMYYIGGDWLLNRF
jgi:pSer/pThr/pTyr-binding forkhead associated (FHA) protein